MAPSTEDWDSHRETILNLRFLEKLPLDHSKTGGRSIVQVMRDEHQFNAKASQYEIQLKKWGAGKNLKKHDWQEIIPAYDNLTRMGLKPRVRHGNQVLDERKIKKARRHLNPTNHNACESTVSPSQPRVWTIETYQENGQYAEYPPGQAGFEAQGAMDYPSQQDGFGPCDNTDLSTLAQVTTENGDFDMGRGPIQNQSIGTQLTPEIPTPSAIILRHTDNGSCEGNGLPLQPDSTLVPGDAFNINGNSPSLAIFQPTSFTAHDESENMDILFSTFLAQDPSNSPFLRELGFIDAGSLVRNEIQGPINSVDSGHRLRYSLSMNCIQPLLQHLSQDRRNHRAATILNNLNSLSYKEYFEQNMGDAFQLISVGAFPMSEIHKTVLYSILNNFAGLENIPVGSIFAMLKNDPIMRSCLSNGLRSTNVGIGKALAENLFRVALEAGDEQVVGIILETTSGRANEIDLNQMICQYKGELYRPIALASYLHHFEMVQKLLSFNAKVNLTSNNGVNEDALQMTIRRLQRRDENKDQVHQNIDKIAGALLLHGAKGNMSFITNMLHINLASEVLERLLQAVKRDHHIQFWIPSGAKAYDGTETPVLELIVTEMGQRQAEKTIRSIIRICHTMGCTPPCGMKYRDTMRRILCRVIEKGNVSLVEYLDYSKPDIVHLTAAIRTGQPEIIALMLKQDIYPSGAVCLKHMSCSCSFHKHGKTTPLAEAIRLQNDELIQYLEDHGALIGAQDKTGSEFDAAVLAAAEVGDIRYLKQLLALVPSLAEESTLEEALQSTLNRGDIEMANILIIHLAKNGQRSDVLRENEILLAAIKSREIEIMNTLFEYLDVHSRNPSRIHYSIFSEAVRWGEESIIEDLLQWGVPLPTWSPKSPLLTDDGDYWDNYEGYSPLVVAIVERKPELAKLFLELGVDPSELGHAIKAGDETMMSLLLHHGAEPADEEAFFLAIKSDSPLFLNILSDAFSAKYPNGKRRFGGMGLCAAIRTHDSSILDAMLQLKLDVNCDAKLSDEVDGDEEIRSDKPLHYAIRKAEECGLDMVRQLLDAGANVEIPDNWKTPILQAICVGNLQVVELLVNKGSDINRPARKPLSRTPLQQACECGSSGIVELLLQRGAEVNAAPAVNGGATALQLAAIQGSARIVRLLLNNKADVHAAPAVIHGRTALEGAAEHGRLSIVNMLLAEGAEGFTKENIESAREYAEKRGHWGCEERLKVALIRCSGGRDQRLLGL